MSSVAYFFRKHLCKMCCYPMHPLTAFLRRSLIFWLLNLQWWAKSLGFIQNNRESPGTKLTENSTDREEEIHFFVIFSLSSNFCPNWMNSKTAYKEKWCILQDGSLLWEVRGRGIHWYSHLKFLGAPEEKAVCLSENLPYGQSHRIDKRSIENI